MNVKRYILICMLFFVLCGCGARSKGNTEDASEQKEAEPAPIGTVFGEMETVGQEDAVWCNLPENIKDDWWDMLPVCRDPKYGIVYYANVGRDYKIYAVRDGKAQMAVPIMGKRLFCRGGKLIFLAGEEFESGDVRIEKGNVLEYDPVSGKVEILIKEEFESITVYQDMICCRKEGESTEKDGMVLRNFSVYFYMFDSGELTDAGNDGNKLIHRCGEYFFYSAPKGFCELRTWDQVPKKLIERELFYFYIKDGTVYYHDYDGKRFCSYHVDSDEEEALEIVGAAGSEVKLSAEYTVLDGRIYYATCSVVSLDTGEWEECFSDRSKGEVSWIISEMYTDGENVYALAERPGSALTLLKVRLIPFSEAVYDSWIIDPNGYRYAFSFSDPAAVS